MKPSHLLRSGFAALLFLAPLTVWSQQMNYQGRLTDSNGNPVADGQQSLTFSLWDAASGGNAVWGPFAADGGATAGHGPLANVVNSRFNIVIGPQDTTGRLLNTAFNGDRYMQLQVAGNSPIQPRQKLLAAPLAMKADIAATVPNGAIGTAQLADGSVTAEKLSGATGVWLSNASGAYRTTGGVGIGNQLPVAGARLHVTNLAYGIAPTAVFEGANCGTPCAQPGWTEIVRLWNSNSNGRSGIGFLTKATGALTEVPDVYLGTGDGAVSQQKNFRIATNAGGTLTDRFTLDGANGKASIAGSLNVQNGNDGEIQVGSTTVALATRRIRFGDGNNCYIGESTTQDDFMELKAAGKINVLSGMNVSDWRSITGTFFTMDFNGANLATAFGNTGENLSIDAAAGIRAGSMVLRSDARIKSIEGRSDCSADLQTLLNLEITNYHFKDVAGKGNVPQKKVIAQQVEKVYPQAVSKGTDVVPDIYKHGALRDGWVELATDLKAGERVQLITENQGVSVQEVLEVSATKFRTAFHPAGVSKVFVYGREVKDFRSVDYHAIAMLNVSATQELHHQLQQKDEKITALEKRLAALETAMTTLAGSAPKDEGRAVIHLPARSVRR